MESSQSESSCIFSVHIPLCQHCVIPSVYLAECQRSCCSHVTVLKWSPYSSASSSTNYKSINSLSHSVHRVSADLVLRDPDWQLIFKGCTWLMALSPDLRYHVKPVALVWEKVKENFFVRFRLCSPFYCTSMSTTPFTDGGLIAPVFHSQSFVAPLYSAHTLSSFFILCSTGFPEIWGRHIIYLFIRPPFGRSNCYWTVPARWLLSDAKILLRPSFWTWQVEGFWFSLQALFWSAQTF